MEKLKTTKFVGAEVLTRNQLKNVLGGVAQNTSAIQCPGGPVLKYVSSEPSTIDTQCTYSSYNSTNYCTVSIVSNGQVQASCDYSYVQGGIA